MKKILFIFSLCFLFVGTFSSLSIADQGHNKPYVGSEAFERMKKLVGSWEAHMQMGKEKMEMKASYKLTSGGSVLIETTHEGTPHEMVSVYHDNKKKELVMTHYCAEHNQPKLILTGMDNNNLTMDLSPDSDIDTAKETHIHSVSIQFDGNDKMSHKWTSHKDGKKDMVVNMAFNRAK
jgi:hypothetical protein